MRIKTQNLLIVIGLFVSTSLIVGITFVAVVNIQDKLSNTYAEFGKILSKTLAVESVEVIQNIPEYNQNHALRAKTRSILSSNSDISFIEYYDAKNKLRYSSKEEYPERAAKSKVTVSSPMISVGNGQKIIAGSLNMGLSNAGIEVVSKTTKQSLFVIILITWSIYIIATLLYSYLITRELNILHTGVKRISTGEFGYKIANIPVNTEIKELFNAFNDMSNRLHQYEEKNIDKLTLERNKFEAVLMSIANGVVVCDNFDNVVLINNAAKNILAVENSQIINSKIQQYCDTNGELCFKDKIEKFKDTPLDVMETKPLEFNIEIDKMVIKTLISPMFSKSQEYVGYIIILINITKEAEIDKLKSDFISNVSHELRTPVTVLRTYIDTLHNHAENFDDETQKEFISVINTEADRLHKMVNEILDFSRLESPNVNLEKTPVHITDLIEESIKSVEVLAREKGLVFSVIEEPNLPKVTLNIESIEGVLRNLISNAIKYSNDGGKIKVRAEMAKKNNFIEVSVEDNGMGIAPELQEKVFDRFFRVENDTHTIKGTGLGLHIVKVTIEQHHKGEVFVQSKLGEGSTFGFRIPITPSAEEPDYPIGALEKLS